MSSQRVICVLLVVMGGAVSCSKAAPVVLPTTSLQAKMAGTKAGVSVDNQTIEGTPATAGTVENSQDAIGLAPKCQTSGGIPLEFCVEGVQVNCVKGAKGEFCTQYVSESDGRMWGPY